MIDPGYRRIRRLVGVVVGLVCAAASLAGTRPTDPPRSRPLVVLQMNLCNSGIAGCYTGRSIAQAAAVIRAEAPDLVTLNEVCENDIGELVPTLSEAGRGGTVITAFQAAGNRRTGDVVRCRNGSRFGIGLLVRVAGPDRGHTTYGGLYPMQTARGEQRAWLCLHAAAALYACTTHLANGSADMARAQCEHLLGTAIPAMRASASGEASASASGEMLSSSTVIGGDLNLGAADALPCLPPGYVRIDDGAVQQIIASADLVIGSSRTIDMRGATDHPGLVAAFQVPLRGKPAPGFAMPG